MVNQKMEFLVPCIMFLIALGACTQGTKQENNKNDILTTQVDQVKTEIEKWKQELLKGKKIGSLCDYERLGSLAHKKWRDGNPDQMDGLPVDDKEIKAVRSDFNDDNEKDLLLFFQGKNCTGHNGGTQTYAKIIYSNGASKSDLMAEVITVIQSEYNRRREITKNLKEITRSYLETTTTIDGYHNGITGKFRLYTKDDAHCCPSYNGSYTYELKRKNMEIEISNNNQ
ncbi:MAG: hypothetical protein OQJ97_07390 [Rhodospirillales bacterium]|nr:hypothetical protein [Rhodospirillales bacterium]